jgi:hypothetical protein
MSLITVTRFWVSWVQPTDDYRPVKHPLPAHLHYWCSGFDASGMPILCAMIDATTRINAEDQLMDYWPEVAGIEWRVFEEKESDWTPGDRFPMEARK